MADWWRRLADGRLVVHVHAQPGAKHTGAAGLHGDALKVRVSAPALEDRANEALIAWLAAALGVARRDVTLVAGARSREKRFEVRGAARPPEVLLD